MYSEKFNSLKGREYVSKRRKIMDIIQSVQVVYQVYDDFRQPSDMATNVDFWEAKEMAEKILEKLGMSKPNFLKIEEDGRT